MVKLNFMHVANIFLTSRVHVNSQNIYYVGYGTVHVIRYIIHLCNILHNYRILCSLTRCYFMGFLCIFISESYVSITRSVSIPYQQIFEDLVTGDYYVLIPCSLHSEYLQRYYNKIDFVVI